VGAVADNALGQKRKLNHDLSSLYHLIPIAIETIGVFSNDCRSFVKDVAEESDCGTMIHLPICHCVRE
jgi:hypothetical protein